MKKSRARNWPNALRRSLGKSSHALAAAFRAFLSESVTLISILSLRERRTRKRQVRAFFARLGDLPHSSSSRGTTARQGKPPLLVCRVRRVYVWATMKRSSDEPLKRQKPRLDATLQRFNPSS